MRAEDAGVRISDGEIVIDDDKCTDIKLVLSLCDYYDNLCILMEHSNTYICV